MALIDEARQLFDELEVEWEVVNPYTADAVRLAGTVWNAGERATLRCNVTNPHENVVFNETAIVVRLTGPVEIQSVSFGFFEVGNVARFNESYPLYPGRTLTMSMEVLASASGAIGATAEVTAQVVPRFADVVVDRTLIKVEPN